MGKAFLKNTVSSFSKALKPVAKAWAREGYFAPFDPATTEARRVAVVACHWIGDNFWASQTIEPLLARFPNAALHVITKPASADLWHGLVDTPHVHTAPEVVSDRRRERVDRRAIRKRAEEIRTRLDPLDLVIDLTGTRYAAYFAFHLHPGHAIGFDGGGLGWLYSHCVRNVQRPGRHLSERPFRVIEPLLGRFAYALPLRPPHPPCKPDAVWASLKLESARVHVLAPGAGWPEKEWPVERFIAAGQTLARRGATVVVTGSPAQQALCERVARVIPDARIFLEPVGPLIALLSRASGVLSNDSAVAHLGAAFGCRTAVIFTDATDPVLYAPQGARDNVRIFDSNAEPAQVAAFLDEGSAP